MAFGWGRLFDWGGGHTLGNDFTHFMGGQTAQDKADLAAKLQPSTVAQRPGVNAVQGWQQGVNGGNVDENAIFGLNKAFADQSVTTGPALQAALSSRLKDMGDQTAEQFNLNGQSPQSGVFADAMARSIGRTGLEAELSQQQARTNAIQNYFGQGRQLAGTMAGNNVESANRAGEFNATNALNTAMFNAGGENQMAQARAGNVLATNQFNSQNSPLAKYLAAIGAGSKIAGAAYGGGGGATPSSY